MTLSTLSGFEHYADEYTQQVNLVRKMLNDVHTATVVKVEAVNADSTVNVKPLVESKDGSGKPVKTAVVYNIPFITIQSGHSAVLMPPKVGDIGISIICHHDITGVKGIKGNAPLVSFRRNSMSDGVYLCGILNQPATQHIQFNDNDITITTPKLIINGNIESTGTIKNNNVNIGSTHKHTGVQTGAGQTGTPV